MTLQDFIDACGQTGPLILVCWYAVRLKREQLQLQRVLARNAAELAELRNETPCSTCASSKFECGQMHDDQPHCCCQSEWNPQPLPVATARFRS